MPSPNIKNLDVDALLTLRSEIDKRLAQKRGELQRQLDRLGVEGGRVRGAMGNGRRAHPRKGKKVPPKYRGPGGETWAGRGAQPRWLTALLKQGRKIEEFAIGGAGGAKRKGGRRKRA